MACFLVTGGAGFLGSHLVEMLVRQGHAVRVLDDLSSGKRQNLPHQAELLYGDVTDARTVADAIEGVDACFHLAAIASVVRCNRDRLRTHEVNLVGTLNIFNQVRCSRRIPVVYASSAAVYGDCAPTPIGEDASAAPLSAYGADKAACELEARVAGAVHAIPTVGLRFFNLYGPRQDRCSPYSGVIALFAERLARGEPVEIFGDGQQVRDFTFVGDGVAALGRALRVVSADAPVFNICTGKGTTVRALAEMMARLYRTNLAAIYRPARSGEVRVSIGDPRRAAEQLGFRAETTLVEGLAITLDPPHVPGSSPHSPSSRELTGAGHL
jgi:UDP-glucose 4-epimerase